VANAIAQEADAWPIMIGSQNLNLYCGQVINGGNDSRNRKNLLATVPLDQPGQAVNSYTMTSLDHPAQNCVSDIYSLTFDFTDDFGQPVQFYPNTNVQIELNVWYKD
jgi:hypothetical protein